MGTIIDISEKNRLTYQNGSCLPEHAHNLSEFAGDLFRVVDMDDQPDRGAPAYSLEMFLMYAFRKNHGKSGADAKNINPLDRTQPFQDIGKSCWCKHERVTAGQNHFRDLLILLKISEGLFCRFFPRASLPNRSLPVAKPAIHGAFRAHEEYAPAGIALQK